MKIMNLIDENKNGMKTTEMLTLILRMHFLGQGMLNLGVVEQLKLLNNAKNTVCKNLNLKIMVKIFG